MKIATYKHIGEHTYETVSDDSLEGCREYVRTSEYVDVQFPPLQSDEVVQRQLDALEQAETELRSKFQAALDRIERSRSELRAITYTP
jgi:hypothetical protein